MASSNYSVVTNNNYIVGKVYWESKADNAKNQSTVTVTLKLWRTNDYRTWGDGRWFVKINGEEFPSTGSKEITYYSNTVMASASKVVAHDSNGSKKITISAGGYISGVLSMNEQSKEITLDTIPRESSLTDSTPDWTAGSNITLGISRYASFRHEAEVYVETTTANSWTWIKQVSFSTSETSKSTSFTTAENKSIFSVMAKRASCRTRIILQTFSGTTLIGSKTYYGTCTNPSASTVTSGTDKYRYVDETFPVSLDVKNSAFRHTLKWVFGSFTKTITDVVSSTTWTLTSTEQSNIYAQIPSATYGTGSLYVYTYYDGVQTRAETSVGIQWHVRNSAPTFGTGYSYYDSNSTTTTITGNNQYIIQNHSDLYFQLPTSANATPKNGASITSYIVKVGNLKEESLTYSSTATKSHNFGKINASNDITLSVTAVDSRGFTTTTTKNIEIVPYSPPIVNTSVSRRNNFEAITTATLSGSCSAITVGTNKNYISSATYRWKLVGGSYGTSSNFSVTGFPSYSATSVSVNGTTGLDIYKAYEVEISVKDRLTTTTVVKLVPVGQPIMFIDSAKKSIGVNKFPTLNGTFEVQGDAHFSNYIIANNVVKTTGIFGKTMDTYMLLDHLNGNVTLNALGNDLYLGYQNTSKVRLSTSLWNNSVTQQIISADGDVLNVNRVRIRSGADASANSTGHGLTIGNDTSGEAMKMDTNELSVFNGSSTSPLHLNPDGSAVTINNNGGYVYGELGMRLYNRLVLHGNGGDSLELYGNDHIYIEYYAKGSTTSRSGYVGYPSSGHNDFYLNNQIGDTVIWGGNSAGWRFRSTSDNHAGIQAESKAWLKWLSSSTTIQVRTADANTGSYGTLAAVISNQSDRRAKDWWEQVGTGYLDGVKNAPVYNFRYTGDDVVHLGIMTDEAPDEIVIRNEEEYEGINNYSMTSYLWKALQELAEQVEYLNYKLNNR